MTDSNAKLTDVGLDAFENEVAPTEARTFELSRSRLEGRVQVSGAKNSVLRLLAASLLTSQRIVLQNYPDHLLDAIIHVGMLESLGKVCVVENGVLTISERSAPPADLVWDGRSIRNTLLILGALVARTGAGSVPLPGGCNLGDRKYDLHELVLKRLGAKVWEENGRLCAEAPAGGLVGADIVLPLRSTGATENALLMGALAKGRTVLWNPHIRPEILDLAAFLRKMGAQITVNGQESIEIIGAENLDGLSHRVMPDNMEAMTWVIGSVITGGDVEIHDFPAEDLEVPLIFLRESGAKIFRDGNIAIVRSGRPYPVEISTGPYPGINSDMQPLFAALGACARGESRIVDLRFADRYAYLAEFAKLGIEGHVRNGAAHIVGCPSLRGAQVRALDLRAGAALALLGLVASGSTQISDAWQIERGYDKFLSKMKGLNASCSVVK